jgi:hypothetical protein
MGTRRDVCYSRKVVVHYVEWRERKNGEEKKLTIKRERENAYVYLTGLLIKEEKIYENK